LGGRGIGLESEQLTEAGFGGRGLTVRQERACEREENGIVFGRERSCGAILLNGLGTFAAAFKSLS
jgi:hypothetical protein